MMGRSSINFSAAPKQRPSTQPDLYDWAYWLRLSLLTPKPNSLLSYTWLVSRLSIHASIPPLEVVDVLVGFTPNFSLFAENNKGFAAMEFNDLY
jgi:hypothetical protein